MADSIEQLSFELTANALSEQERALSGLRARAGTVLASASIAGSFLGAKTGYGALGVWGVLAMISFALCVGSAIWVLLPHALVFAFRGDVLLAESDQRGMQAYGPSVSSANLEARVEQNSSDQACASAGSAEVPSPSSTSGHRSTRLRSPRTAHLAATQDQISS